MQGAQPSQLSRSFLRFSDERCCGAKELPFTASPAGAVIPLPPTEEGGAVLPGADQRQFTTHDVYELRQIIDAGEAEEPPHSGHGCVVNSHPIGILRLARCRSELEKFHATAPETEALVATKDWTRSVQLDCQHND